MKYLFLDCFLFFSPQSLASALYDMTKNKELLQKLGAPLKAIIHSGEEKRCGMEAMYLSLNYEFATDEVTAEYLFTLCEKLDISEKTKEKLIKYIHIISEAKSIDPNFATFEAKRATDALIFTAYALEIIKELEADKLYVSKIFVPSADDESMQEIAQKISNSLYILKKHRLSYSVTPVCAPSFTEECAALAVILDLIPLPSNPGDIIKIGYGAVEDDTEKIPNILRAVYGEENEYDVLFEAEEAAVLNLDYV